MIRPFKDSDYSMICSWWNAAGEPAPSSGMMGYGTFVLELDYCPALSLTVFLTQSKQVAYIEGFIKNPEFKQSLETEGQTLWNHCFEWAKARGAKNVFCYCKQPKLEKKYERFGMTKVDSDLSAFVREL